jgi:hypothetical protein
VLQKESRLSTAIFYLRLPDQEEASACNEGTYKEATSMGLNEVACAFG